MQILALRREQCSVDRSPLAGGHNIVGDQPLEEFRRIPAGHAEHAPVLHFDVTNVRHDAPNIVNDFVVQQ